MKKILNATGSRSHRTVLSTATFAVLSGVSLSSWAQQNVGTGNSTVFATGNFDIPEQITAAPIDFGGGYLVSDAGTDTIYHVSPNRGTATVFSANGFSDRAGLQLSTYYNGTPMAAQYLEVGTNVGQTDGIADLINMNGTATSVVNVSNAYFEGITTATSNYGAIQSGPIP